MVIFMAGNILVDIRKPTLAIYNRSPESYTLMAGAISTVDGM